MNSLEGIQHWRKRKTHDNDESSMTGDSSYSGANTPPMIQSDDSTIIKNSNLKFSQTVPQCSN